MKKLVLLSTILLSTSLSFAQCLGTGTTGTYNLCFLNVSRTGNINLLNVDSVVSGKWYGSPIGVQFGGTGTNNPTDALNSFLPNQAGNAWKFLATNGTNSYWQEVTAMVDTNIYAKKTFVANTYQPKGNYLTANQNISLSGDVSGSGTTAITCTLPTINSNVGTFNWVTVNGKGQVTAAANDPVPTPIAAGARNFNQAYQLSSTRPSRISVSPSISCNLTLVSGASGQAILEISPNGTTGWIYSGQVSGSNTGTLTVGLNTTQITGGQLTEDLPAGYYWRIRTNNVTGTPTYTFNGGSERIY